MQLDHFCIAVRSIEPAAAQFGRLLGYCPKTRKVTNTRQDVNVQFLSRLGSLDLKLIEPASADSPLQRFLRRGEGLHHVCFLTNDTPRALTELEELGLRVLFPPAPGAAFEGGLIAFGYAGFGLTIELVDTARRGHLLQTGELPPAG
jgi:methylmalonyl-CoA/ethylmalonyl-CoA epimerase